MAANIVASKPPDCTPIATLRLVPICAENNLKQEDYLKKEAMLTAKLIQTQKHKRTGRKLQKGRNGFKN